MLFILLIVVSGLQLFKPEWFLIEVQKGSVPKLEIKYVNDTEPTEAPTKLCYQNYSGKSCYYDNLPTDKPYISQTRFGWIYNHQVSLLVLIFLFGFILNYDQVKQWIRTHSN